MKGEVSENKTEMKEIKDYLPFYLGCQVGYASHHEPQDATYTLTAENLKEAMDFNDPPHLRPLSDMTEEEAIELAKIHKYDIPEDNGVREELINIYSDDGELHLGKPYLPISMYKDGLLWLLKQGFDLFGLIESGLAISKTQTQEQ